MLQSRKYGLPIVVYKTTGTLSFNTERESALMADVNAMIENYRNGTPIPNELLFNPEVNN